MRPATRPAAALVLAAALAAGGPALAGTATAPDAAASDAAAPDAAVQDAAGPPRAAGGPVAPAVAPGDPVTSDMRCIVVAGALLGADDEQLKSVGRASLFYYVGRLQGRGDVANLNARIVAEADRMTSDDIKAQAKTCSAQFTAATQALQDLSDAFQQHFAPSGGGGGGGVAPK